MSNFIKVTTFYGKVVWLNPANIVSITESKEYKDTMVVYTNAVDNGEGIYYLVQGSPEVFIGAFGGEEIIF